MKKFISQTKSFFGSNKKMKPIKPPVIHYYKYISDSKIDMLFNQIPDKDIDELSEGLEFDFKILKYKMDAKKVNQKASREYKTQVVENFINTKLIDEVGSIDQPKKWIRGKLNMRWGIESQGVWFCVKKGRHILFLGGSEKHLIGRNSEDSYHVSDFPEILNMIVNKTTEKEDSVFDPDNLSFGLGAIVDFSEGNWGGIDQEFDFLARNLFGPINTSNGVHSITIGSPIFVRM